MPKNYKCTGCSTPMKKSYVTSKGEQLWYCKKCDLYQTINIPIKFIMDKSKINKIIKNWEKRQKNEILKSHQIKAMQKFDKFVKGGEEE